MKILVTGGAGFIGSHVVDAYIDVGHEVIVIDNLSAGKKENLNEKAVFYDVDIRDEKALRAVFEKEHPEVVNHHAAHASVSVSVDEPIMDADNNIFGSIGLAELCVEFGVEKFLFASTGGALYGDADVLPTPETHATDPVSPYGVSKLSFEKYLHYYHAQHGLEYTVLRYANIFGERQDPHGEAGVVAIFCKLLHKDQQPVIYGDGEQTRDFVYVKDVAQANLVALQKDALNGAVNISTEIETSVNSLFDDLVKISEKSFEQQHADARQGDQRRSVLSFEKARNVFDWKPQVILGEESGYNALLSTYKYFA